MQMIVITFRHWLKHILWKVMKGTWYDWIIRIRWGIGLHSLCLRHWMHQLKFVSTACKFLGVDTFSTHQLAPSPQHHWREKYNPIDTLFTTQFRFADAKTRIMTWAFDLWTLFWRPYYFRLTFHIDIHN